MAFDLQRVLQALLLSSNQPLSVKDIQAVFDRFHEAPLVAGEGGDEPAGPEAAEAAAPAEDDELYRDVPSLVTAAQIRECLDALAADWRALGHGLLLLEGPSGYRAAIDPRFARWVRILRQEPPPVRLTASALETLAVVAYRQPVTKAEIEAIRGVSAEAGLARLLERELVAVTDRADLPGRPLLYATTDRFLEFVGLRSTDELPASDVLTSRQIDEWLKNAANPRKPGDADMGLAEEGAPPAEGALQP